MKGFKRWACVCLCAALIFGFAACATEDVAEETTAPDTTTTTAATTTVGATTTAATTTTPAQTEEVNPLAEKLEISWLGPNTEHYEDGRWDQRELEELFNIRINVWNIDNHSTEQIMMMIAAGDFPNIADLQFWNTNLLVEAGLIRSVKREFYFNYIPSYAAAREEDPYSWDIGLIEGTNDEYWGIMKSIPQDTFPWTYSMFRLDWLNQLGYEFDDLTPVDVTGQTYITNRQFSFHELNDIYRAFTEDDPNNTGQDDTYARLWIDMAEWESNMSGMFNVVPITRFIHYDEATGDYVDFRAYTGLRDYWEWLTENMEKGYIIPRNFDAPWSEDYQNLLALPNIGHLNVAAFAFRSAMPGHWAFPPTTLLNENPDVTLVFTPPPQGPSGEGKFYIRQFTKWTGTLVYFSVDTTDDQLARILMMLEYTCYGENSLRYAKGIEGVHFVWEGEPMISRIIATPMEDIPPRYRNASPTRIFNIAAFATTMYPYLGLAYRYENYFLENYWRDNEWFEKYGLVPEKNIYWALLPQRLEDRYREIGQDYNSDINAVYNDFKSRVFAGDVANLNMEWGEYVNSLYAAGYRYYAELFNDDEWIYTAQMFEGSRWIR